MGILRPPPRREALLSPMASWKTEWRFTAAAPAVRALLLRSHTESGAINSAIGNKGKAMVPCGQPLEYQEEEGYWLKTKDGHKNYSGQELGVHYRPRCKTFVARNEGEYIGVNTGGGTIFLATISVTGFGGEIVFFFEMRGKSWLDISAFNRDCPHKTSRWSTMGRGGGALVWKKLLVGHGELVGCTTSHGVRWP